MKHTGRITAFLLTLVLCVSMLGAAACLAAHTHHICRGADCAVCATVAQCSRRLDTAAAAGPSAAVLLSVLRIAFTLTAPAPREAFCETPVSLKVKLLD